MVTQQAPLVDVTSSQVAGNIDRRQMAELPLQGRNWQELSLMVKGMTANNVTNTPGASDDQFQLNLDGQQITQRVAGSGFGQPKISREAIAEFQIVTNMFDITQGRSTGMQVQAISRSGTNDLSGRPMGSSAATASTPPTRSRGRCCPSRTSRSACTLGGPIIPEQDALLRRPTSTSGSRPTRSCADAAAAPDLPVRDRSRSTRTISAGSTINCRPRTPSPIRGQRWA